LSAVSVDTTFVDVIGRMSEDDFPTQKVQELHECRIKELQAISTYHENVEQKLSTIEQQTEKIENMEQKVSSIDEKMKNISFQDKGFVAGMLYLVILKEKFTVLSNPNQSVGYYIIVMK
jgi:phage-related protein